MLFVVGSNKFSRFSGEDGLKHFQTKSFSNLGGHFWIFDFQNLPFIKY